MKGTNEDLNAESSFQLFNNLKDGRTFRGSGIPRKEKDEAISSADAIFTAVVNASLLSWIADRIGFRFPAPTMRESNHINA